jgi:hypothetical protein
MDYEMNVVIENVSKELLDAIHDKIIGVLAEAGVVSAIHVAPFVDETEDERGIEGEDV